MLTLVALTGPGALQELTRPAVATGYLTTLSIFPVVNLWEETAWMGMVQSRLTARRGAIVAAAVTGPLFGLQHLALHLSEPVGQAATSMLILMALAIPFRLVLGWLYSATGGSILLVAITHATFNATNNSPLLAHQSTLVSQATWYVVGAAAVVVGVLTRGRFVARPR
jgi:membrane protease YdiL (CAAX protease family)